MRGVSADAGRLSSPSTVHHRGHGDRHRGHRGVPPRRRSFLPHRGRWLAASRRDGGGRRPAVAARPPLPAPDENRPSPPPWRSVGGGGPSGARRAEAGGGGEVRRGAGGRPHHRFAVPLPRTRGRRGAPRRHPGESREPERPGSGSPLRFARKDDGGCTSLWPCWLRAATPRRWRTRQRSGAGARSAPSRRWWWRQVPHHRLPAGGGV